MLHVPQDAYADEIFGLVFGNPLHRELGLRPIDPDRPQDGLAITVADKTVNAFDVLHGGIVPLLIDVSCYLAVVPELEAGTNAVTHSGSTALMRGVQRGAEVEVRGRIQKAGRTLYFCAADVTSGGKLVASGTVVKSVVERSGG